jgi:hypothetical protein
MGESAGKFINFKNKSRKFSMTFFKKPLTFVSTSQKFLMNKRNQPQKITQGISLYPYGQGVKMMTRKFSRA